MTALVGAEPGARNEPVPAFTFYGQTRADAVMESPHCAAVHGRPTAGAVWPDAAGAFEAIAASSHANRSDMSEPAVELFSTTTTVIPVSRSTKPAVSAPGVDPI